MERFVARSVPTAVACTFGVLGAMAVAAMSDEAAAEGHIRVRPAANSKQTAVKQKPDLLNNGHLSIIVSLKRQRVTVWDANGKLTTAPISSGRPGFPTPTGIFTVVDKRRIHFSNIYDAAPMPYMQRLTWSGVAMHAGVLPGYPASHGCIRLPPGFAQSLYGITTVGTRVIVAQDELEPVPISHPRLFAPLPPDDRPPNATGVPPLVRTAREDTAVKPDLPPDISLAAPAATGSPQRTRATVAADRLRMRAHLTWAVTAAIEARAAAAQRLEEANDAVQAAREKVKQSQAVIARIERTAREARRHESELQAKLATLIARNKSAPPEQMPALAQEEEQFERDIAAAGRDAEDYEAELREAESSTEAIVAAAHEAEAAREAAGRELARADEAIKEAKSAVEAFKQEEKRRALPITVFVSRKTGRLYVRQGFQNILDIPVAIHEPRAPIGTHVFTAHAYGPGERSLLWSVVTVPTGAHDGDRGKREKGSGQRERAAGDVPVLPQIPEMALERIDVPPEARDLIAELIRPGASLIVSDLAASGETGKYTDFIILTR